MSPQLPTPTVRVYQLQVTPGQPSANTHSILTAIAQAKKDGIDLIAFPEMAISGYLISDEWERLSFLKECVQCGEKIRQAADGITVVFGNVAVDFNKKNYDGRVRKYNACFIAENQEFLRHPNTQMPFFIKLLMPNYREFDDHRHFFDPRNLAYELELPFNQLIAPAPSQLGLLGCMICEDGWDEDYDLSPSRILKSKNARALINISCSPYTFSKNYKRYRVFSEQAKNCNSVIFYVNACGLQDNGKTVFTLDGGSCIYNADGHLVAEVPSYQQAFVDGKFEQHPINNTPKKTIDLPVQTDTIENQYQAIHYGTKKFLERAGIKRIVVGISGGIDSAVIAAIYARILPKDAILLVNMPGPYTSQTTIGLAQSLANNLDLPYAKIPIQPAVELTSQQIIEAKFKSGSDVTHIEPSPFVLENIQARDRSARILAGVAATFGGAFTCNANKSEMTIGYSTLYGDLGGCLAAIADLWKGEVYELAHWLNQQVYGCETIPKGTIDIVPSAELSAHQNVDQNKGDPLHYPYHDALFRSWVERWDRATPEDNLQWYLGGRLSTEIGFQGDLQALFPTPIDFIHDLERWWNLYQGMAIAKRIQAPPIIAVKRRAFGFDHRESQLGPRYSSTYTQLKSQLLHSQETTAG